MGNCSSCMVAEPFELNTELDKKGNMRSTKNATDYYHKQFNNNLYIESFSGSLLEKKKTNELKIEENGFLIENKLSNNLRGKNTFIKKDELKLLDKCIVNIETTEQNGNGFFALLPLGNTLIPFLLTNEHIVTESMVNNKESIKLKFSNGYSSVIKLNKKERNIFTFNNKKEDVTLIEINKKDYFADSLFLDIDTNYFICGPKYYNNKSMNLFTHDLNMKQQFSFGTVNSINDYNFKHNADSYKESEGAPITLNSNLKLFGIHKLNKIQDNILNEAVLIGSIIEKINQSKGYCLNSNDYINLINQKDIYQSSFSTYFTADYYINDINEETCLFGYNEDDIIYNQLNSYNCIMYIDGKLVEFTTKYKFNEYGQHQIQVNINDNYNITDMSYMFSMTPITEFNSYNINTSKVVSMKAMFNCCSKLHNVIIDKFNTENVENMSNLFNECISLSKVNLSSFDTSNVKDISGMFHLCSNLSSLDLNNFNTYNINNMQGLFEDCTSINEIKIDSFNTTKVNDMSGMFNGCSHLTNINLSNFITNNVYDMSGMFSDCSSLTKLDLSSFNTDKVINMSGMFNKCISLTTLNISSFNTSNVSNMKAMFNQCSSLNNINVSNFITDIVSDMSFMFNNCSSVEELLVDNFHTENVENMKAMFQGCSLLKQLNLSNWNTSKVQDISYMFNECKNIINIYVLNWNTENVIKMQGLFQLCISLSNIDITSFNTYNVTDMTYMFSLCEHLQTITVSKLFKLKDTTEIDNMFLKCPISEDIKQNILGYMYRTYFEDKNAE